MSCQHKLAEYIKQWGNFSSISLFDPRCEIFTHPSIDGAIGHVSNHQYTVAFGDPLCSKENIPHLAGAFHLFAQNQKTPFMYLSASEEFARWAMQNGCHSLVEIEEELILDPAAYPKKGPNGRLLNKKVRHAQQAGVIIEEYTNNDPKTKEKILQVESIWLKERKGPQIYVSHVNFFENECDKRCFYAKQNEEIVGIIFLHRLEAKGGWLLYHHMTTSNAPGGTSESLIVFTLDKLAEEGCHFFSFGVSAIEEIRDIVGLGKFSRWLSQIGFKIAKKIFSLDNRRKFWLKFEPQKKRSFIIFSNPYIGFKEVLAIMRTVNASIYS